MQCRQARTAVLEFELDRLGPERSAALGRHLRTCVDCGREQRQGRRLSDDLALLRGEVPIEIDVASQVMARVNELGRPAADEIPLRHWILAAVAAVFGGILILGALWDLLPGLAEPARNAIALLAGSRGVAESLSASAAGMLAIPFKLLGSLFSSLLAMAPLFERLAPLGAALASLAVGAMSVTVVFFVGRDLRTRPLPEQP